MTTTQTATAHKPEDELLDASTALLVGGGIITMSLFPFALPAIVMAAVLALPFVLGGLAVGVVAAPVLLVRRLTRSRTQD